MPPFSGKEKDLQGIVKRFGTHDPRNINRDKAPLYGSTLDYFNRLFNLVPEPIRTLMRQLPDQSNTSITQSTGCNPEDKGKYQRGFTRKL